MAVMRKNYECEVCGASTLVRIQLGWLNMHPIRFNCGECGILITGQLYAEQQSPNVHIDFDNVKELEDISKSDYYIEVSGELLTKKLQSFNHEESIIPPFFSSGIGLMGEQYNSFKEKTYSFLYALENKWAIYRRFNELWFNKNYKYLKQDLKKHIPNKEFPLNNELQYLTAIRQININILSSILNKNFFDKQIKFISDEIVRQMRMNPGELNSLAKDYGSLLHRYDEKIFDIIKQFTEKFRFMIPVFGADFYEDDKQSVLEKKGITTVSFEELKLFYVDIYEVITELLDLIISYNNLKYRNNYQLMKTKRRDIVNISDYRNKTKGTKLEFLDGKEEFDKIVFPHLDNKIRNAIGHNTYRIDVQTQEITFYPKGDEQIPDILKLTLSQFTRKCWDIFQALINLSELVYQTRKVYYLSQRLEPSFEHIFIEDFN